ncbi:hypothetical protein GDO78_018278 [Eleutherodactylus coqui]|uniref:Uncharacterized protein n=1 Tax=Eleutherodactylus coqui TaxID=57060 RepID=A0A8J6JZ09_ELECQ|nr:hypothetical protein GDO78_018278 [Eleutherodactylus coqui]
MKYGFVNGLIIGELQSLMKTPPFIWCLCALCPMGGCCAPYIYHFYLVVTPAGQAPPQYLQNHFLIGVKSCDNYALPKLGKTWKM